MYWIRLIVFSCSIKANRFVTGLTADKRMGMGYEGKINAALFWTECNTITWFINKVGAMVMYCV